MSLDHSKCCYSTGIHGGLTAGQGNLDNNGFWSIPCDACMSRFAARENAERTGIFGADLWAAVYAEAAAMEIAALRLRVLRLGQRIAKDAARARA